MAAGGERGRVRAGFIACLALASMAGCGGGGGSAGAGGAAGSTTGASQASASAQQWQTALVALGPTYAPAPISVDAAGCDRWSALTAQSWSALRTWIDPELDAR